jgi:hypothetical protein
VLLSDLAFKQSALNARNSLIDIGILFTATFRDMAQLFLLLIAASLVPVCSPLFRRGPLSGQFWKAIGAVAFSACLQIIFVISVARNVLTLEYSLRFAIVGIPTCILAIVLAKRGHGNWRPGATISPAIGMVIWAILITLH